jgi:hypothetical protein
MKKITPQGVWSSPIEIDLTSFSTENLLENLKKILERIETLKEKIVEIKGTGFSDPVTSSLADLQNLFEENTQNLANKTLDETITGSWTFNSPITVPTIKGLSSNRLLITGRLYGVEISINENSTGTGSFVITKEPSGPGLLFLRSDSGNLGIGTMFPSEKIHVVGNVKANQFISTVSTGTAPLQVSSITKVDNLNADLLDDYNASTNAIIETVAVRDSQGYIAAYGIKGPNSQDLVISGENKGVIIEIDKDSSNNDYFSIRSKGDPVLIINSGTNNVGISVLSPSEKLEVYGNIKAEKFISTLPTGTAPLQVSSTTLVTNLNSDLLDGYHASTDDYVNTVAVRDSSANLKAGVFISTVTTGTAPLQISSTTKVTNLNADLLDGYDSGDFPRKAENATISGTWTFNSDLTIGGEITGRYNHANRFVVQSFLTQSTTLNAQFFHNIAFTRIYIPTGKSLYLRRVRWELSSSFLRPRIYISGGSTWEGSAERGDVSLDTLLVDGANDYELLGITIDNTGTTSITLSSGYGIWAEFEIR